MEQSNSVTSKITVTNAGSINAGDMGVSARDPERLFPARQPRQWEHSSTRKRFRRYDPVGVLHADQSSRKQDRRQQQRQHLGRQSWHRCLDCRCRYLIGGQFRFHDGGQSQVIQTDDRRQRISIDNAGSITAGNLFAIDTEGASTTVTNRAAGVITGFVDLSDEDDLFDNQAGGIFEARLTSNFGDGDDLFTNEGMVRAVASVERSRPSSISSASRIRV